MSEDKLVVVCLGVDEADHPIEGSMITRCMECGKGVWISPVCVTEHPTAEAICLSCASDRLTAPNAKIVPPSPAQLQEIEQARKRKEEGNT